MMMMKQCQQRPAAAAAGGKTHRRRRAVVVVAATGGGGGGDQPGGFAGFVRELFNFEAWAPRSSRAWRLNQYEPSNQGSRADADAGAGAARSELSFDVLAQRTEALRRRGGGGGGGLDAADDDDDVASTSGSGGTASFSDADDDELAAALAARVGQVAAAAPFPTASLEEADLRRPLTGEELKRGLLKKYGKAYDVSFVKRQLPGMRPFVSLNIMWLHLGQQSFPLTAEQYDEKLDSVAALISALGRSDRVRAFLAAPAKSSKGLPRRPVVGSAISVQLDLDPAVAEEFFGAGFQ